MKLIHERKKYFNKHTRVQYIKICCICLNTQNVKQQIMSTRKHTQQVNTLTHTHTHTHTHTGCLAVIQCTIDSFSIYNSWYNTHLRWSGNTHTHTQTGSFSELGRQETQHPSLAGSYQFIHSLSSSLHHSLIPPPLCLSLFSLSQHITPLQPRCQPHFPSLRSLILLLSILFLFLM